MFSKGHFVARRGVLASAVFSIFCCAVIASAVPAQVEVKKTDGRYQLLVDQKPFYIRGAGLEYGDQTKLAAAGGNSFRTWTTDNGKLSGREVLDLAHTNGLFVTMGLDVARERQGFDYSDTNAVAKQLAAIQEKVMELKDHPNLLMWDIGNELNLDSHNPKVWDAVNEISRMIHHIDPNHPTTTSVTALSHELVEQIKQRAPDLDLLSVQSYADIVNLQRELKESGWNGPYIVTEWGATGHWECGKTTWGAPIEDNSSLKGQLYQMRFEKAIAPDPAHCLGSYVFLWGQKQERTPTWYSMFLSSGEATAPVDVMQYLWTGKWPEFRSPEIKGFTLDQKSGNQNIHLEAGGNYKAHAAVESPNGSKLQCSFEVLPESDATSVGGDLEDQPMSVATFAAGGGEQEITVPHHPGAYRLFVYARDVHGRAAYANIPFFVDGKTSAVAAEQ